MVFVMAAGGTGGHVMPALAVARELRRSGHEAVFIGTLRGLEARLVPTAGFRIEWIRMGGWQRVGLARRMRTAGEFPLSTLRCWRLLGRLRAAAVLSLGSYVAAPVCLAAFLRGVPVVVLEPNATPGLTNRWAGRRAARVLVNFEQTAAFFDRARVDVVGVPVREEFFQVPPKVPGEWFELLVTGGSQGSRTLNRAARESWPLFVGARTRVRMVLQTGPAEFPELALEFERSGMPGRVTPFLEDMPRAFAEADLVVCRAGAGALAELAAAGKPAILVPFPYAADQHQLRNAEALARAGAARLVEDRQMNGHRLFEEVCGLAARPQELEAMARAVRRFARPDAARRVAAALLEVAGRSGLDGESVRTEQ
ncbi:MAG: undecaprenyldiphospho-muramoylpentapeptide beta-N-acetylglucosaminyltransferase [Bryobacterales bacterium]|nr:undecaprenyldiphospho-muramoylpentapeptide beta-N-acetylglucosaminyltransferase [Bryobacteraceae bacterium]MDW8131160.1 undecaprenyldiphospho-muramoylpentapeptide beta-N-acetylglucosaminyltransferase [Bryobacterales bacterium]